MESPFSLLTSLRWDPILKDHPDCVYGAPFYLLGHHRERLLNAARWFNERGTYLQGLGKWGSAIAWLEDVEGFERDLVGGIRSSGVDVEVPLRVRVTLPARSKTSPKFTITAVPTPSVPLLTLFPESLCPLPDSEEPPSTFTSSWTLHIDTLPTLPTSLTSHKTTARRHYDFSRERCALPPLGSAGANNEVVMYNPDGDVMEGTFTTLYFWRKEEGGWITPSLEAGGCEATVRKWLLERGVVKEGGIKVEEVRRGEWVVMSNAVRGVWGGRVV
ncbi:aminotransferase [Terfezia claveryi]|nr:aminotransferase [Terfezia claveryi]